MPCTEFCGYMKELLCCQITNEHSSFILICSSTLVFLESMFLTIVFFNVFVLICDRGSRMYHICCFWRHFPSSFGKTKTFSIASCHTKPLMRHNYIHSCRSFANNAIRWSWWALPKDPCGGASWWRKRGVNHMVWDPSCHAACFLWFLSAGRPVMPSGAIDRAERDGAARQTCPLRGILI